MGIGGARGGGAVAAMDGTGGQGRGGAQGGGIVAEGPLQLERERDWEPKCGGDVSRGPIMVWGGGHDRECLGMDGHPAEDFAR